MLKRLPRPQRPDGGAKLIFWKVAIATIGTLVSLAGVAMIVLPGPGLLVIVIGLSILGAEYAWAARLRDAAKDKAVAAANKIRRRR